MSTVYDALEFPNHCDTGDQYLMLTDSSTLTEAVKSRSKDKG